MNWNRGKNSSAEKAANGKILLHVGLWKGNLNNELESWQELLGREGCEWRNQVHVGLSGENLNNELESWQELFGRESCESRNTIACWALGGENLNNELESRQELLGRESCEWRNLLHVELWGGSLNNELESWQELLGREGCEWRNLLLVELLGGKFKQWTGIGGRTLRKRKLWIEKYYCMLSFGGGNLNHELESWKKSSAEKAVNGEILLHVGLWGGKFKQWIGVETGTLRKRKLCIEKSIASWALGGEV